MCRAGPAENVLFAGAACGAARRSLSGWLAAAPTWAVRSDLDDAIYLQHGGHHVDEPEQHEEDRRGIPRARWAAQLAVVHLPSDEEGAEAEERAHAEDGDREAESARDDDEASLPLVDHRGSRGRGAR